MTAKITMFKDGQTITYKITGSKIAVRNEVLGRQLQGYIVKLTDKRYQHQGSLTDQLRELHYLANENGLYDAADYIRIVIEKHI